MAGLSMVAGADKLSLISRIKKIETEADEVELRRLFDDFLKYFRKESCAFDAVYPPMLGTGKAIDLVKLYLIVRKNGGYDAVSKNGLWDAVAHESGCGVNVASSVKLAYAKYLTALDKCAESVLDDKNSKTTKSSDNNSSSNVGGVSGNLGFESEELSNLKSVLNACASGLDLNSCNADEKCSVVCDEESSVHIGAEGSGRSVGDFAEVGNSSMAKSSVINSFSDEDNCKDFQENLESNMTNAKVSDEDEVKSNVVDLDGSKKCDVSSDGYDANMVDSDAVEETNSSCKRKRTSTWKMLKWVTGVARNPCDDAVTSIPEWQQWESYGNDELWKQVLLARQSLFLKRNFDASDEQSSMQKSRKMHPSMYDDNVGSMYNFRERSKCVRKLLSEEASSNARACSPLSLSTAETDSDSNGDSSTKHSPLACPVQNPIPLGPDFQAEIPEWTGVAVESDSKWLGLRVWPPEKVDNRFVVEREPVGKGRQDSCGCEVAKSIECVRFHCNERRMRVKRELGAAFYHWRFDNMGEDVRLYWTKEEEKKFNSTFQSNPPAQFTFWDEIAKALPKKKHQDIVSYYFNVFVVERRAFQNRFTPYIIYSDDEEDDEWKKKRLGNEAPKSPGSLLQPAKRSRRNGR